MISSTVLGIKLEPGLKINIDKYSPCIDFKPSDISTNMTIYLTDKGILSCDKINAVSSFIGSVILCETLYPYKAYYSIYVKSIVVEVLHERLG